MISSKPDGHDAIIMDLNMPGVNGLELVQCAWKEAYERPIIAMSGRITEDEQLALSRLHVHDIVGKPFSNAQLEKATARAFSRP
jgi:DNA-binding response OmpR family regulator